MQIPGWPKFASLFAQVSFWNRRGLVRLFRSVQKQCKPQNDLKLLPFLLRFGVGIAAALCDFPYLFRKQCKFQDDLNLLPLLLRFGFGIAKALCDFSCLLKTMHIPGWPKFASLFAQVWFWNRRGHRRLFKSFQKQCIQKGLPNFASSFVAQVWCWNRSGLVRLSISSQSNANSRMT